MCKSSGEEGRQILHVQPDEAFYSCCVGVADLKIIIKNVLMGYMEIILHLYDH